MTEFTPISGAIGGLLIGCGVAVLLLANDRVAGISGILGQALWPSENETRDWRIAFLIELPIGAGITTVFRGPLTVNIDAPPVVLVAAGLLVGFGTRLGNGCTSGQGVCGVSRGAPRSIAETLCFTISGAVTVVVMRLLTGAA